MATALDLKLKPGEKVLVAVPIMVKIHPDDFLNYSGWERKPYWTQKGNSFRNAPQAEVLEVDEEGTTRIRYNNGGEKNIHSEFTGFARNRTRVQRTLDSVRYFVNRHTTLNV